LRSAERGSSVHEGAQLKHSFIALTSFKGMLKPMLMLLMMASLALMVPPTLPRWKHLCSYNTQIRNETKRDGHQRKVLKLIARPDEEQEKGMRYIYMVRDRDRDRALGPRVRNAGYEERRSQFRQRNRLQKATEAFQARVPCVLFTLRRWELQDTR